LILVILVIVRYAGTYGNHQYTTRENLQLGMIVYRRKNGENLRVRDRGVYHHKTVVNIHKFKLVSLFQLLLCDPTYGTISIIYMGRH